MSAANSWFVFVKPESGFDCERPLGNPLNLRMDTRMIVKCRNSFSINKLYSIFENTTEVIEVAVWSPGSHLDIKMSDDLLQVKKDMKGIVLRTAEVRKIIFR